MAAQKGLPKQAAKRRFLLRIADFERPVFLEDGVNNVAKLARNRADAGAVVLALGPLIYDNGVVFKGYGSLKT